jgi:hypothetical protein
MRVYSKLVYIKRAKTSDAIKAKDATNVLEVPVTSWQLPVST